MFSKLRSFQYTIQLLFLSALVVGLTGGVNAQSLDAATPAPIRSNNLIGKIAARDLGDSRLTDHYYALTGTPGDLMITIQSRNLNGDLDVFTAGSLRPLLKLNLYAETTTPITKGIYLRKRENLILRIEARSPNDDEGTYQLFFGGSFEPIVGGSDIAENETPSAGSNSTGSPGTRRVSSVGARLPEPEKPVTEVAAAPTPTPEVTEKVEEPKPEKPKPAPRTRSTTAANTPRTRRPNTRTTPPKPKPEVATTDETNKTEENKNSEEPAAGTETTPKTKPTTSRTTPRRGAAATNRAAKPKPETPVEPTPEPEMGPRLVIETSDGTLINRSMSTVRRVVVENGQVVVTAKDGKIDRIPLTNVVRMSIAP